MWNHRRSPAGTSQPSLLLGARVLVPLARRCCWPDAPAGPMLPLAMLGFRGELQEKQPVTSENQECVLE